MDLIQNSIEAGSSHIQLNMNQSADSLEVSIRDDGCGMTDDELKRATDPFYTDGIKHKHRKVGLGLPFLIQTVTMTDGQFDIRSEKNKGTEIDIRFNLANIDTPPTGHIVSLLYQVLCFQGDYDLTAVRSLSKDGGELSYQVNRNEMLDVLGDLESAASLGLLRDFINSQEEDLLS
ncbi:hypothetical protein HNR50_002761 [Spirochaeta isovalerica]|uniref:Histidine kinase domain-containing protein n=2 Tax=Spirochaeta isovalerica TaxID=150 RepID=A0A841REQ1_9SPIO|nr:hypothetical protein [Spirochaeta isovalerica]